MKHEDLDRLAELMKEAADGLKRGARMQGFESPVGVSMMAGHYAAGAISAAYKNLALEMKNRSGS